jgi:hypothetical protein
MYPVGYVSGGWGFSTADTVGHITPLYDNSGQSTRQSALASGTPFTWTQPVTSATYAVVGILGTTTVTMDLAATAVVTFGGATLSSLGSVYLNNQTTSGWIMVYGGYTTGSGTQTASVTLTESGKAFTGFGTSATYLNVSSVGTLQTAFGSSAAPSVTVPSATNDLVWGLLWTGALFTFTSPSFTSRQTSSASAGSFIEGDTAGAASVTISATASGSALWAAAGLNLI